MAAYFSEQLSQNVKRGMRTSAEKGQSYGSNLCLGYKVDADKKFIIDPETAPTVRLIYNMYAEGKTAAEIVELLNRRGLRTLRGRPFTHNSLRTILKNEMYIGVYSFKDEIRMEGAVPAIVDEDTFYKVQEMLKYNQKAAAHKNSKVDYLLTEKLFCGKCGEMMVGVSGRGRHGGTYHYYYCNGQRRKVCHKKPVRRSWIENLVLEYAIALVKDEGLMEFIAESTYQYYLEQTESLKVALADVEKSMSNLIKALEAGIFNDATKQRMDELDEQKSELIDALAAAKLREDLGLKKEHILYFLHRFAEMDYTDEACQKQFCDIWKLIADRYKNEPVILGYELINESIAPYFDIDALNPKLEPLHKRAVKAIREVDQNHIILLGGPQWNSIFSVFKDSYYDDKLMYTCHRYGGAPTAEAISHFIQFRDSVNLPMYMGEIGHGTDEWQEAFCKTMEANNIGYTFWPYKKINSGCMMGIPTPDNWDVVRTFSEAPRSTFSEIREARPDQETAKQALMDYVKNSALANCLPQEGYIRSILLKVP